MERRWGKQDWHELKTLYAHHLDSHYSLEKWVLFSHVRNWRNWGMAVKYWPLVQLPTQIIINYNGSIRVSGIRELAQTSLWELIACIISQLCLQWHHIGSLISAMVGVFTPRRSTNVTDSFPPWSQLLRFTSTLLVTVQMWAEILVKSNCSLKKWWQPNWWRGTVAMVQNSTILNQAMTTKSLDATVRDIMSSFISTSCPLSACAGQVGVWDLWWDWGSRWFGEQAGGPSLWRS